MKDIMPRHRQKLGKWHNARQQEYYERNRDKILAQKRAYGKKNRKRLSAYGRKYRVKNDERLSAYYKEYRLKNRDRILAKMRQHRLDALAVIALYHGDAVPRCRIDLTPGSAVSDLPCRGKLQLDHLNGGGTQEMRAPQKVYKSLVNGTRNPKDFRPLCELHQLWNTIIRLPAQEWANV